MSSVDQRIVSMKFDNKQFESNVGETLKTINKLEKSLDLPNSAKGLNNINDAAKKISFNGLERGIETVKVKFSALEVMAITALANITNSAINAGKRLVSSLTIDPIMDGFREYETQMNSIQTVLANTSSKGTTLKEVTAALDELNLYADKTIYNFTEMTRNIGTFTAAGVDLKTSTAAIKGIANLAAVSGSTSQQASTAMYQLSQALAAGTVKLQDWNSVVNAGMGGEVFQKSLIETAKVHGIAVDKMIKDEGSFRETLQKGWLTSEILTETLSKFTGDLNEKQLKSMGYTDEQIKGIIKMGNMANDAATKVKTFTQLIDTLQEAVGSGWAQTWQTVFGDFEEAKVLFTGISNTLGGMIEASSDARNKLLKGWKDLGGRKALIDSFKNAFDGVMGVVKSIGGAFREIFPPTTSKELYNITNGLKQLTENFKLSDSTLANLKSTFKGFFAILDIGKDIGMSIIKSISIMVGGTGDLASGVLHVTGAIGEWISSIHRVIKESDVFNKVLTNLAYVIRNGFSGISYVFKIILEGIGNVITALSKKINLPGLEGVHSVLNLLGKRMTSIGDEANSMSVTVGGAFVKMGKSIADSKIGILFTSIWKTVKKVANAVGELVNRMVDSITTSFQNADFSVLLDAVAGISIGGMLLAFKKFMEGLSETVENSKGLFSNIKGVLDDVRGSLESYQKNLKSGILLRIATAISLLSASIVAISLIDSAKLVSSLAAIGTLFAQLLVATKVFTLIGDSKTKVMKANTVMISMSIAILILSDAMNKIAKLDWNGVAKGSVGIAALAGILVTSAKLLSSGNKTIIKGASSMIIFAFALKTLSSSCVILSKLSWDGLARGLLGVGVLMTEISLFLNNTKFSAKSISTAIGITILAGAMTILAKACSEFGSMSWDSISKGLTSVGLLLTEIGAFNYLTSDSKKSISSSIGIIAIATAMKILSSAMINFSSMSWEGLAIGLTAMGGALAEIAIAMNFMPKDLPITATGLVIVSAALNIMASALIKMGGMTWNEIGIGLTVLGGALTILSVSLSHMRTSLAGSAALLVAAGALSILTPILIVLGSMSWESIAKGLVVLGGSIGIFGASAAILTPVIPSMFSLAASMALLGVSMIGLGAGLALVGVGLSGIATGFTLLAGVTAAGATAIVTSLGIIITGVIALIPAIMSKIGEGIVAFCKVFTDSIPAITECISTILKAIIQCIIQNTPLILECVSVLLKGVIDCIVRNTPIILDGIFKILTSILEALVKWVPKVLQNVVDLVLAILKVISDNIPKFISAGVDIIVAFIKGISDNLSRIIESAFNLIITFINGLAEGIRKNSSAIGDACLNLVDAIVDGIASLGGKFIEAGKHAVEGFIKGLSSIPGKIWNAGKEIGTKALNAAKDALAIHSPSRKFGELGEYSALGFVDGLGKFGNKITNESSSIGERALDSMSNAISNIYDMFDDDLNKQPVISPVLDLTDIQNGSKRLYSLMNQDIGSYNLDGSMSVANLTARQVNKSRNIIDSEKDIVNSERPNTSISNKQPVTLQLVLQNGKAIAEYIIDDVDSLMGSKNKISGRMVGI